MIQITAETRGGDSREISLKSLKFQGGEMHVTVGLAGAVDALRIRAHLPDSDSVMTLLLTADALRIAYPGKPITLDLPYVPYARQDRVANVGESLSAKVFCNLINAQGFDRVIVQDPHSDVVSALLDRVVIDDPLPALRRALDDIGEPVALVAPDAGARKRVMKLAKELGLAVVFADKERNPLDGKITGTEVHGELPVCPLLVVDDICDGGRTFTELATALGRTQDSQGFSRPLYLYVTHGIFSKGLDPLLAGYSKVYTRNNWTDDRRAVSV
jgi:ribose-phosphate pyrophosphokinase